MKKTLLIILAITLIFAPCATAFGSCNYSVGPGKFTFRKVHICLEGVNRCIEIDKWHNDDVGIEVQSKQYGAIFFSEGTYILIENKCPICDAEDISK